MTCPVCEHPERPAIDEAIRIRSGWKRLAKAYKLKVPDLMLHKAHAMASTVKAAIKRAGNTARKRGDAAISLDTISRRLNKLSIAAEASGNSGDAIRALTALQQTLAEMRASGQANRQVQVVVKYDQAGDLTNPRPELVRALRAYLDTSPPPEIGHHGHRLLALLEKPAHPVPVTIKLDDNGIVQ